MLYSHADKAGNRADVWKHAMLVSIADHLPVSDACTYVESHSGAPLHELSLDAGGWRKGIGSVSLGTETHPYVVMAASYLRDRRYPASWVFVGTRLARKCRAITISLSDTAPEVHAAYPPATGLLPENVVVRFTPADGYALISSLVSADLVFMDPPFAPARTEWKTLAEACMGLNARSIPYVAWYPFHWPTQPQHLLDRIGGTALEACWSEIGNAPSQHMAGCGMLFSPCLTELARAVSPIMDRLSSSLGWRHSTRRARAV